MMNEQGYNEQNLQRLATFLAYGDVKGVGFDMTTFASVPVDSPAEREMSHCGSAGCAVGWATFIWPKPLGVQFSAWSFDMFIASYHRGLQGSWSWCFAGEWHFVDNTRLGAAKRIQFLLNNKYKLPLDWDCDEEHVALYANTEVKRESKTSETPHTQSQALIAELVKKISREPKLVQLVGNEDK